MKITVKATRNFCVGHKHMIAITKDQIREVELSEDGSFSTYPDSGDGIFGRCRIGQGWEIVEKKSYIVTVNELHRNKFRVLAKNKKEAGELVLSGHADMIGDELEFIETTGIHRIKSE